MENKELLEKTFSDIEFLQESQMKMANEIDGFYELTLKLIKALMDGKPVDTCLSHWSTFMKDGFDWCSQLEMGHYKAHVMNLIAMVDEACIKMNEERE